MENGSPTTRALRNLRVRKYVYDKNGLPKLETEYARLKATVFEGQLRHA